MHAQSFCVSVIHQTLTITWTTGSLTCVRDHSYYACVYTQELGTLTLWRRVSTIFLTVFLVFLTGFKPRVIESWVWPSTSWAMSACLLHNIHHSVDYILSIILHRLTVRMCPSNNLTSFIHNQTSLGIFLLMAVSSFLRAHWACLYDVDICAIQLQDFIIIIITAKKKKQWQEQRVKFKCNHQDIIIYDLTAPILLI